MAGKNALPIREGDKVFCRLYPVGFLTWAEIKRLLTKWVTPTPLLAITGILLGGSLEMVSTEHQADCMPPHTELGEVGARSSTLPYASDIQCI
jgi:hypothetical protein